MYGYHEGPTGSAAVQRYLEEAAAPMKKIPQESREAFLDEIRSHLESLIEEYESAGATQASAEERAIRMMGSPKKLGRSLVLAWYRSTEPGTVLGAIGIAMVAQSVLAGLWNPISIWMSNNQGPVDGFDPGSVIIMISKLMLIVFSLCAGAIAGWLAPKRAVIGAIVMVAVAAFNLAAAEIAAKLSIPGIAAVHTFGYQFQTAILVPAIAFAWLGRRARMFWRVGI